MRGPALGLGLQRSDVAKHCWSASAVRVRCWGLRISEVLRCETLLERVGSERFGFGGLGLQSYRGSSSKV